MHKASRAVSFRKWRLWYAPIWFQLSVTIVFILTIFVGAFGFVVMERQKASLFENTMKVGLVSLYYFVGNAKIPLLNDDILELNRIIKNASSVDGLYYAFIVDNEGKIKAHTDYALIDTSFRPFTHVERRYDRDEVHCIEYISGAKGRILNLSSPIVFDGTHLGEVHVGLSINFVHDLFLGERAFLAASILVIVLFGMIVAVLFSLRFSRPISKLVRATEKIGRGQYDYQVNATRKDELGLLGAAFNRMSDELYRQSVIKDSFGKYVGADVLDMIMQNPEAAWLKGQRHEVSILLADIRGFTGYSETKRPEEVVEKLNEFFEIASSVVMRYGGYVDKFMGDAVMAVFGAPIERPDHAKRCLMAALEMRHEFLQRDEAKNVLLARVGIGLASGQVLAGNIGSQIKTEYTVIGDCVNVAAFLNNMARSGEILLANGLGQYENEFEMESLPAIKVKGREGHVPIFRLIRQKNQM